MLMVSDHVDGFWPVDCFRPMGGRFWWEFLTMSMVMDQLIFSTNKIASNKFDPFCSVFGFRPVVCHNGGFVNFDHVDCFSPSRWFSTSWLFLTNKFDHVNGFWQCRWFWTSWLFSTNKMASNKFDLFCSVLWVQTSCSSYCCWFDKFDKFWLLLLYYEDHNKKLKKYVILGDYGPACVHQVAPGWVWWTPGLRAMPISWLRLRWHKYGRSCFPARISSMARFLLLSMAWRSLPSALSTPGWCSWCRAPAGEAGRCAG